MSLAGPGPYALLVRGALTSALLMGCHQNETRGTALSDPAAPVAAGPTRAEAVVANPEPGSAQQVLRSAQLKFTSGGYREVTWQLQGPFGAQPVVVVIPAVADEQHRLPVLVVFHGRGEALKAPLRGARGFIEDYGLLTALQRLEDPPLSRSDFGGFIAAERLRSINDSLAARPYQGLIVVCPYLPDILRTENLFSEGKDLAQFITSVVLPKVYAETPALPGPAHTAVDGVSLGGRAALAVLAFSPQAFAAAAATQPAVDEKEIARLATLAARARQHNPGLRLRLLTSDEDYFLQPTRDLSRALHENQVAHQLDQVRGNHSYEFNRGPGVYEMLLFADHTLHDADQP
jgi:enterochelin esterase-like enzyme